MELHKRRKAITEPETRYFMNQILLGVKHLHDMKIIHRDLKLGNIFLNDQMEVCIANCLLYRCTVNGRNFYQFLKLDIILNNPNTSQIKLGDFGLATKIDYDGERKRTLCGTPNYIAPEVLGKKGKFLTAGTHPNNFGNIYTCVKHLI